MLTWLQTGDQLWLSGVALLSGSENKESGELEEVEEQADCVTFVASDAGSATCWLSAVNARSVTASVSRYLD